MGAQNNRGVAHIQPVLLGSGARLFAGVGANLHGRTLAQAIAAPNVTHRKFARP